jgi:hypothetical protein
MDRGSACLKAFTYTGKQYNHRHKHASNGIRAHEDVLRLGRAATMIGITILWLL